MDEPEMKAKNGYGLSSEEREKPEVFGMKSFSSMKPVLALRVLLIATLLLFQAQVFGQAVTGTVTGVVKDKTGALVPHASVTLTDTLTNVVRTVESNKSGYFAFVAVPPSTAYVVRVTAPHFDTWESQPIPIRPGDQAALSDIALAIGSATQEITVEASTPDMKTLDSAEHSDVITGEELQTLPVEGRDAGELLRMLPGFDVQSAGVSNQPSYSNAVVGLSGPSGAFSANGTGTNGVATILDGVSITDIDYNSGTIMNLNVDMISEVKVTTSTFGADNSKGPAIVNAIGKSGTAQFHGMGYVFARDTALNSNGWENNHLRQDRPDGSYFYPGGMIGGPILLPFTDFNRNKDKLFFYVAYEYSNQHFSPGTLGSWVPTMAERAGDFGLTSLNSQLCGARPDGKVNPNAILAMCQTENFLPNGAETVNGNIAGQGNSSGVALLNWLPLPNANPFTNDNGFNYIQEALATQNGSQFHAKVDYHINESNSLSVGYYLQRQISDEPVSYSGIPSGSVLYPGAVTNGDISNVMFANYVHNFSPTVTNELNLAMSLVSSPGNMGKPAAVDRFDMNSYNCNNAAQRAAGTCTTGNGNYDYFGVYKNSGDYSVPALTGNGQNGYPNITMPGGFYANHVRMKKTTPDVADNLTWQRGRHLIKTGFYYEDRILNGLADYGAFPQGAFSFNPGNSYFENNTAVGDATQYTGCENSDPAGNQRLSGAAYLGTCMNPNALMYLGYADSFQQTNFSPVVDMNADTLAGYVMDTWNLKRFTLNLGVRLEHIGAWSDRHGNGLATFSPSLYNQECGGVTRNCVSTYAPGVTWHGIDSSVSNSVNSPPAVWASPRLGISWDMFGKGNTVLRGGWGIYRSYEAFAPYASAAATAQGYKSTYLQGELSFDSIEDQSPTNPADFSIDTISKTDSARPIFYEYNFTFDQAITWRPLRSLIEVSYVGSTGQHLDSGDVSASSLNNIAPGALFNPCPGTGLGAGATTLLCIPTSVENGNGTPSDIGSLTTAETDFFRPYPFYAGVYELKHNFYSSYNSVQIQWNGTATLGAGMTANFGANYTFSKNLGVGAGGYTPDPFNIRNDYTVVPYDRTGVFNVHYLVDLGSHHSAPFAALRPIINGWQISGISSILSGQNLASVQGVNFGFGYGQIQPVQVSSQVQTNTNNDKPCQNTYGIPADPNGNHYCVFQLNPTVWLGTPDLELAPTLYCNPAGGPAVHQYINPLCYGIPRPGSNGNLRPPYIHGPALYTNDLTLLKNFKVREKDNLQLRLAAFNFLNHALTSFDPNNITSSLTLSQQFGTAGQRLTAADLTEPGFGIASIKEGSRLVELSAKYTF